ncbi:MAG: ABC transporter substrate-binding protein [Methanobrevibacter sp.]|uniref:ABC transporter substrate-binding protein n=1 Tax=Methanobrevibacter sp. TaxID=66852 RepID=UPI0025E5C39E|nr:ABC transporter substrate-binding protein [Methanobrevibacter sp.]MBQ6100400.1 ABC transporter substrate-binding protein [Methanobrevibacter sp.]
MNKKSKVIILMLVILVVAGIATHLFLSPSSVETQGSKNITDMVGRSVTIPASVNNVVATSPPMTTVLYMIAPDKLKAVNFQWTEDELKYVPSQYANYPVVGGWYGSQDGSYEEFIATEPNIIIESIDEGGDGDLATVNERQQKFGTIPVVAVNDTTNVEKVDSSITFMGEIIGAQDKAKQLTDFNDKYLDIVHDRASKLSDGDKKTVYYAQGDDGLQTNPSHSTHGQLIDLVGGKNVADAANQGNTTSGIQVSIEQVISWNPDVIITGDPEFYAKVYSDSNWASINAVKNKEVYLSPQSPFKWFDRPVGANMIIGVPWTAKVIYPDDYKDIDMVSATKEFYSNFYHFDLSDDEAKQLLIDSGLKESNL